MVTAKKKSIEQIVQKKFKPYLNRDINELAYILGLDELDRKSKRFHSSIAVNLTKEIFNVPRNKKIEDHIEEFRKSDITIKTVRLDRNEIPCEDVSLPAFDYFEIYNGNWRESKLKEHVERKYLFVFFQYDQNDELLLKKVKFWNMDFKEEDQLKKFG